MKITLALGGGGARGNSHIGVIRRLEREGFTIEAIAGTSAGGIIAACFASGMSTEKMEEIFSEADQSKLWNRNAHDGPSLLGVSGFSELLQRYLGDKLLQDLPIPCAVTAVDIKSGKEVVIDSGSVVDAVQATIALPGIFPPVQISGQILVDGGVLNPVPVSVARYLKKNLPVVAVVLTPLLDPEGELKGMSIPNVIPSPIADRIKRTRLAQAFNIFLLSVDAGGRLLTELRLKVDSPEVVIRPDVSNVGLLDPVDIHEMIRLGEQAVEEQLEDLHQATSWPGTINRKLRKVIKDKVD
ncbi:patatin-like phospholipase family protein [Chloroflexota bacterium]